MCNAKVARQSFEARGERDIGPFRLDPIRLPNVGRISVAGADDVLKYGLDRPTTLVFGLDVTHQLELVVSDAPQKYRKIRRIRLLNVKES